MQASDKALPTPFFPQHSWTSAHRCGPNGGNCVEVNHLGAGRPVGVRDSKDTAAGVLVFDARQWDTFLSAARTGLFDLS